VSLIRHIDPLEVVPRGWGLAYRPWNSLGYVVSPVPFNLMIGASIAAWRWLRALPIAWESPRHRIMRRAFLRGYERGERVGKEKGFQSWSSFRDREIAKANARADAAMELAVRMQELIAGKNP